ncbi:hypothetical protein INR49_012036, partial [Caranx melampygus]
TLSDAEYVTSKLSLVDLAGSERLGKTGSEGQMLKEATYINKSLSFLEQAIIAMADRHREHVPFRQTKLTHALKDSLDSGGMRAHGRDVVVFVRIRPTANFAQGLIECLPDGQTVNIYHRKDSKKLHQAKKGQLSSWSFRLDGVLQDVSQEVVYTRVCRKVVQGALDGYNGTVMCFGQTGAGKTFTMTGSTESYKQRGIIPRALQEVFQEVERRTEHSYSVHLSYLEIYNETMVDLLAPLQGSSQQPPQSMLVMESQAEGTNIFLDQSHSQTLSDAEYVTSKLSLVDLAGSERLGKTGSEGQMLKEATYINKSLSFLEQAIIAMADRHREHVPFRQTKLTHALKDSLLSTLRFASRMKRVPTDPAVVQIKKLQKEVQMLKEELSIYNTLVRRPSITYEPLSEAQLAEINSQVQRYLDGSLKEINVISIRQVQAVFAQFKLAVKSHPPKAQTFEDFKVGPGSRINCILKENKAVLLERRSLLHQLTEEVNAVKREIDCKMTSIQRHKQMEGTQVSQYLVMEEEPDATLLLQLKELKSLYRQRYQALHDVKAEVNYCEHLVDQCRVRLLSEFETWYEKTILLPEEELDMSMDKNLTQREENQSENLTDSPSAESFYSARCRTLKRGRKQRLHQIVALYSSAQEFNCNCEVLRGHGGFQLRRPCLSLRLLLYKAISSRLRWQA